MNAVIPRKRCKLDNSSKTVENYQHDRKTATIEINTTDKQYYNVELCRKSYAATIRFQEEKQQLNGLLTVTNLISNVSFPINDLTFQQLQYYFQNSGNILCINTKLNYFIPLIVDVDCNKCKSNVCVGDSDFLKAAAIDCVKNLIVAFFSFDKSFKYNLKFCHYTYKCGIHIYGNILISLAVYHHLLIYLNHEWDRRTFPDYFIDNPSKLPLPYSCKIDDCFYQGNFEDDFNINCNFYVDFDMKTTNSDYIPNINMNEIINVDMQQAKEIDSDDEDFGRDIQTFDSYFKFKVGTNSSSYKIFGITNKFILVKPTVKCAKVIQNLIVTLTTQEWTMSSENRFLKKYINNSKKEFAKNEIYVRNFDVEEESEFNVNDQEIDKMLIQFGKLLNLFVYKHSHKNYRLISIQFLTEKQNTGSCSFYCLMLLLYYIKSKLQNRSISDILQHLMLYMNATNDFRQKKMLLYYINTFYNNTKTFQILSESIFNDTYEFSDWFLWLTMEINLTAFKSKYHLDPLQKIGEYFLYLSANYQTKIKIETIKHLLIGVFPILKYEKGLYYLYKTDLGVYEDFTEMQLTTSLYNVTLREYCQTAFDELEADRKFDKIIRKNALNSHVICSKKIESEKFNSNNHFVVTFCGVFNIITGTYMAYTPMLLFTVRRSYCIGILEKEFTLSRMLESNCDLILNTNSLYNITTTILNNTINIFSYYILMGSLSDSSLTYTINHASMILTKIIKLFEDVSHINERVMKDLTDTWAIKESITCSTITLLLNLEKSCEQNLIKFIINVKLTECETCKHKNRYINTEHGTRFTCYDLEFNDKAVFISLVTLLLHFNVSDEQCDELNSTLIDHIKVNVECENRYKNLTFASVVEHFINQKIDNNLCFIFKFLFDAFLYVESSLKDFLNYLSVIFYYPANNRRKVVYIEGPTSTGKSTFFRMLNDPFKPSIVNLESALGSSGNGNQPTPLHSKLCSVNLCIVSEATEFDASTLKTLTGGDNTDKRTLYSNLKKIKPLAYIMAQSNTLPKIKNIDPAIHNRLLIFKFETKYVNDIKTNNDPLTMWFKNIQCKMETINNKELAICFSNVLYSIYKNNYDQNTGLFNPKCENKYSEKHLNSCFMFNNVLFKVLFTSGYKLSDTEYVSQQTLLKDCQDALSKTTHSTEDFIKFLQSIFTVNNLIVYGLQKMTNSNLNADVLEACDESITISENDVRRKLLESTNNDKHTTATMLAEYKMKFNYNKYTKRFSNVKFTH